MQESTASAISVLSGPRPRPDYGQIDTRSDCLDQGPLRRHTRYRKLSALVDAEVPTAVFTLPRRRTRSILHFTFVCQHSPKEIYEIRIANLFDPDVCKRGHGRASHL